MRDHICPPKVFADALFEVFLKTGGIPSLRRAPRGKRAQFVACFHCHALRSPSSMLVVDGVPGAYEFRVVGGCERRIKARWETAA